MKLRPTVRASVGFATGNGPGLRRLEIVPFLQGERGLPGFSTSVTAEEPLGGHRAVTVQGRHANPEDANFLAGITTTSANEGQTVDVVVKGLIEEFSWNWTPDAPIFLGPNGVLTQTPSTTGPLRRIAWAINLTTINVDIMPPVLQA